MKFCVCDYSYILTPVDVCLFFCSEFLGPVIGGVLSHFLTFQDSAAVSMAKLIIMNCPIIIMFNFLDIWRSSACVGKLILSLGYLINKLLAVSKIFCTLKHNADGTYNGSEPCRQMLQ